MISARSKRISSLVFILKVQLLFMLVEKRQIRRGVTRRFQQRKVPFVLYQDEQVRSAESLNRNQETGPYSRERRLKQESNTKILATKDICPLLWFACIDSKDDLAKIYSIRSKRQLHFS